MMGVPLVAKVRGWLSGRSSLEVDQMRTSEPIRLPEEIRGAEGRWVALKDGKIVAVQDTPSNLYAYLHSRKVTGTTILRVPGEEEPELVGLG